MKQMPRMIFMSIHDSFGFKYANSNESFPLSGKKCTFHELMNQKRTKQRLSRPNLFY